MPEPNADDRPDPTREDIALAREEALAEVAATGSDADWFSATGRCGYCGEHGDECRCTPADPCLCAHLHPMGSGYLSALERLDAGLPARHIPGQGVLL